MLLDKRGKATFSKLYAWVNRVPGVVHSDA